MIFAIQLLDRTPVIGARERRRLRSRNHLFHPSVWGRAEDAALALRDIFLASLRKGARAAAQMALPIGVVQVLMVTLVAAFYFLAPVQEFFRQVVEVKLRMGMAFAFLSMGGISVMAEVLRRIGRPSEPFWGAAAYGFAVFGVLGVMTDGFYVLLDSVWGGLPPASRTVAKMATDQFLWTVLLANPYQTLLYVLKDCRLSQAEFIARTRPFAAFYAREMLPVLVTNWAYWIPTTLILYCLPVDIQFVTLLLAVVIWILLLTALTKQN